MTNRRDVLIGAAAMLGGAVPAAALMQPDMRSGRRAATGGAFAYDYLLVEVKPGAGRDAGQAAFLSHLTSAGAAAVAAAGGEVIGYFAPLIGWSSEQLGVMLRWQGDAAGRERAVSTLLSHSSVASVDRTRLAATTRPGPTDRPQTGGIYTHRWFTIRTADLDEFDRLSNDAWPDFESEFAARIFGLFRADASPAEAHDGVSRMLLNTWYQSHAVWNSSRRPSAGPAGRFNRRAQLTLTTRVVSLRYTAVQPTGL